jgi:hypothetical protein
LWLPFFHISTFRWFCFPWFSNCSPRIQPIINSFLL